MVGFDLHEKAAEQVHMALVPYVSAQMLPAANRAEAAIKVALAEDYSYDRGPELEQAAKVMLDAVRGLPDSLEESVRHGGPAGLRDGQEFQIVAQHTSAVLDRLEEMREKASQRVSYAAETAANEAINAVAEMLLSASPDAIMAVVTPALQERSSA